MKVTSHWLDRFDGHWSSVYFTEEEINDGALDYLMLNAKQRWGIFNSGFIEKDPSGRSGWHFLLSKVDTPVDRGLVT